MRSIHLGLYALFTSAVLLVSCAEDELVDDVYNSIPGKKISFNAKVAWQEENNSDSRNASMSLERMLVFEETSISLPMNVSVQEGIHSTSENVPMSRGSVLTKEAIDNFNVWAALNKDAESVGEGTIEYFSGVSYSKDNSGIFSSQTAYYWPGEGPTLDFVAVANMPLENFNANTNNNEVISFTYTVPSAATAQNDIAIATATGIEGDNNTSVPLSFNHIMSAVNFKVGTIAKGVIKSITLNNIYTTGTYHIYGDQSSNNLPYWVVDEDELGPYSVTFAQTDTNGNYNPEGQAGNLINGSNATFMMIPQVLNDNATLTIEFIHDGTTTATTLPVVNLATLKPEGYNGNFEWKMNHTTNYLINVDEDYQINIEPIDAQDAHYVICPINISVSGLTNSDSWSLSATDDSGENVNWISFRRDLVGFENDHYWVDPNQCYLIKDNNKQEQLTGSNNIYNRTTTLNSQENGNIIVYAFLTENTGTISRSANINLTVGESSTTQELTQLCPSWNGSFGIERSELDYGAERYTTSPTFPWGFAWEGNSVTYHANPEWGIDQNISNYRRLKLSLLNFEGGIIQFIISLIRFLAQDIEDIAPYITPVREQVKVETENWWGGTSTETKTIYNSFTIDFSQLSDLNGKCFDTADGLQNCTDLYTFSGNALSNIENTLVNLGYTRDPNSKPVNDSSIQEYAVLQALKKNKFSVFYTPNSETGAPEAPSVKLATEDLVWFLPASGQYVSDMDSEYKLNGKYWSSTAVEQTVNANMVPYNNDTKGTIAPKARTESYQVRAARKK